MVTRGRTALLRYLRKKGAKSQSEIARALGVSAPSFHSWTRGTTRPEAHFRLAIERLLGIAAESWMTTEERAALARIPRDSSSVELQSPDDEPAKVAG